MTYREPPFFGFGGGFDLLFGKHFAWRMQADLVRDHLFNDLLTNGRYTVRFSCGPAFNFGKSIAGKTTAQLQQRSGNHKSVSRTSPSDRRVSFTQCRSPSPIEGSRHGAGPRMARRSRGR
jgi:hypothetical protein